MHPDTVQVIILIPPSKNAYDICSTPLPSIALSRNFRLPRLPNGLISLFASNLTLPFSQRRPHPPRLPSRLPSRLLLRPPPLPLLHPLLERRHGRPRLNRLSERRYDLGHDVADVLGDAPAGLDGDDVAEAQGGAGVVDEDFGCAVKVLCKEGWPVRIGC